MHYEENYFRGTAHLQIVQVMGIYIKENLSKSMVFITKYTKKMVIITSTIEWMDGVV